MLVIPTPESIYRGNYASLPANTLKPPIESNRTVPIEINWLNSGLPPQYTIHFNARQQQTLPISQISALHIDNSQASSSMHVAFPDTQFEVIVGPNTVGFYPVVTNSLEFWCWIDKTPLAQDKTIIQVLNFLPPPIFFTTQPGGTGVGTVREVDTVAPLQGGPITDIGTISLATPLALNFGGTGSTTPGGALDNLSGASGAVAGTLVRAAGTPGVWSVAAGLSSPISVSNGGTGLTSLAPGNRSLVSNGTGNVIVSPIMTDNGATISISTNQVIGAATPGAPSPGLTVNAAASAPAGAGAALAGTQFWLLGDAAGEGAALLDGYGTASQPGTITRRARGTAAAPTAVQLADTLTHDLAYGYTGSAFAQVAANDIIAAENWTGSANGSWHRFYNTTVGTATLTARMDIRQGVIIANGASLNATADPGPGGLILNGNTAALPATGLGNLSVGGPDNTATYICIDSFGTQGNVIQGLRTRGTAAAPTGIQAGDVLLSMYGVGRTSAGAYTSGSAPNITLSAAETWSGSAQGSGIVLATTPNGSTAAVNSLTLAGNTATFSGNVVIGAGASSIGGSLSVASTVTGNAYATKAGSSGATDGHTFNISWGTSGPTHLWIDAVDAGSINLTPCDERLKTNLKTPTVDALGAINAIALKQFDWLANDLRPEHHETLGFTAQQLNECIPDAVTVPDDPDAMLSVQLTPIVAHLIGAVQQLSAENDELRQRLFAFGRSVGGN